MTIRTFKDGPAVASEAATHVAALIKAGTGPFHLVLSGGSTPKKLYELLASSPYEASIPWERVHFWWGDERFVPPTDEASNEGMARAAMLDRLPVKAEQIHAMFGPGSAEEAASAYEVDLRNHLSLVGPDLTLLGLGPDAHTASLFPGDPSIDETERWVVASTGAAGVKQRLTLTPPILNLSKQIVFLAVGPDKAEPLSHVVDEDYDPHRYPAQIVARNAKDVIWFVDESATVLLRASS